MFLFCLQAFYSLVFKIINMIGSGHIKFMGFIIMRLLFWIPFFAATLLMTWPVWATDAPFCVEIPGLEPQCLYYDPAQCRQYANQLSGFCSVNINTVNLPAGVGNFCLVLATQTAECIYPDLQSCDQIARANNGLCVRSPERRAPPGDFRFNEESFF